MLKLHEFPGALKNAVPRQIPIGRRGMRGSVNVLGRAVPHESELERDFLWLATLDRTLTAVRSQPISIEYEGKRGRTRYTPDFATVHGGDPALTAIIEIKYREDIFRNWNTLKPAFMAGRRFARENAMRFIILTEVEIRGPALRNAKVLSPYRALPEDWRIEQHLIHRLAVIGPATPEILLAAAYQADENRREARDYIFRLIAEGRIETDLDTQLSMGSPISVPDDGSWRIRPSPYSWQRVVRGIPSSGRRATRRVDGEGP